MPDYSRYRFIKIEVADRLATVTLNRPESLNALNRDMHRELEDIWLDLADDANVTCVLLTGAGRAFCAGGDVKNMAARVGTDEVKHRIAGVAGRRLIHNILDFQPPIVGAINGDAAGLGATNRALAVRMQEAITRVLTEPDMRKTMLAQGLDVTATPQEEFAKVFVAEIAKWGKVVKQVGIEVQ